MEINVLCIRCAHRKPTDFGMKISGGLLGAQLMVEGLALDKRFTYLIELEIDVIVIY